MHTKSSEKPGPRFDWFGFSTNKYIIGGIFITLLFFFENQSSAQDKDWSLYSSSGYGLGVRLVSYDYELDNPYLYKKSLFSQIGLASKSGSIVAIEAAVEVGEQNWSYPFESEKGDFFATDIKLLAGRKLDSKSVTVLFALGPFYQFFRQTEPSVQFERIDGILVATEFDSYGPGRTSDDLGLTMQLFLGYTFFDRLSLGIRTEGKTSINSPDIEYLMLQPSITLSF